MAMSEARKRANKKWNDANMRERYDQIAVLWPKGERDIVKAAAKAAGVSLSVYVMSAVRERMERERGKQAPADMGNMNETGEEKTHE